MSQKILCVIPSRIASTRLPNKPLLLINGKPMIQLVYEQAISCSLFDHVVVATDNETIAGIITKLGGHVALQQQQEFSNGSERVAATAQSYQDMDIVVNLQGDLPFATQEMITDLLKPYQNNNLPEMTTVASPLLPEEHNDPGVVKAVCNKYHQALYFSRSMIPYPRHASNLPIPLYHHLGLYAFRRDFLQVYSALSPTPLEQTEQLEQLRVLEHGYQIVLTPTAYSSIEINTPEDYFQATNTNKLEYYQS